MATAACAIRATAFDGTASSLPGRGRDLALVALPYAAGERPVSIDRGISYAILAAAAVAGVVLFVFTSPGVFDALEGLLPDRAYGFWISALGAIIMARAAYDIWLEPPRR